MVLRWVLRWVLEMARWLECWRVAGLALSSDTACYLDQQMEHYLVSYLAQMLAAHLVHYLAEKMGCNLL